MAKRTRKQPKRKVSQQPSQTPQVAVAGKPAALDKATSVAGDLAQEYAYVFADLRKIAVIAAVMFVLLVVLALVLQ